MNPTKRKKIFRLQQAAKKQEPVKVEAPVEVPAEVSTEAPVEAPAEAPAQEVPIEEEILDKLVELILLKDIEMIDDIRNIYFNLMITNFSGTEIITNILSRIISNENISEKQKLDIIKICNDGEFNMGRGRREINQFDMLIISIIDILK